MPGITAASRSPVAVQTTSLSTPLGWMALAWKDDLLCGLVFGHATARRAQAALNHMLQLPHRSPSLADDSNIAGPPPMEQLVVDLHNLADGEPVDFRHIALDETHLTPFARRVTAACRQIPWGQVRTYGQLATACGSPGAARAVGQVMAANRFPLVVPCHRVLAAGGRLGGYSAPQGPKMKRRLLAMEQ